MKKELSPSLEMLACDVCGRTILKGERAEPYLVPDGTRRLVCDLCTRRAEGAGWLRESRQGDMPATMPRTESRGSLLTRLRRRFADEGPERRGRPSGDQESRRTPAPWEAQPPERYEEPVSGYADDSDRDRPAPPPPDGAEPPVGRVDEGGGGAVPGPGGPAPASEDPPQPAAGSVPGLDREPPAEDGAAASAPHRRDEEPPEVSPAFEDPYPDFGSRAGRRERRQRRRQRDPRHVRAVPSGAEAKVERALELFNASEHRRTVGGLARTLGSPLVAALPVDESTSEVTVVVGWELSWYQYRIDLADSHDPVTLTDKGHEIDEIDPALQRWNATATDDGALAVGGPSG